METKKNSSAEIAPKTSDRRKKIKLALRAALILLVLILYAYGFSLEKIYYTVKSDKLETKLNIVFISDLHNCFYYDMDQSKFAAVIRDNNPDLIMFGGDMVDQYGGTQFALRLADALADDYICCYAPGNHEMLRDDVAEFEKQLADAGVHVLDGSSQSFTVKGQNITVFGIEDTLLHGEKKPLIEEMAAEVDDESYNILLMHQPQQIDDALVGDFDLILSGHAHGGQWRFPIILEQGLYAPDQGLRPQYTGGMYECDDSVHIISKGLARPLRMIVIPRIFNRPELTIIEIE